MTLKLTRRQALHTLGALAATRVLPGCGSTATPGTIDTLVFLLMENRSYDHYLGSRTLLEGKPGDGLVAGMANPDQNGVSVPSAPAPSGDALCVASPPHEWDPARVQFNGGACDGFVRAYQSSNPGTDGSVAMSYLARADLPVHYALADAYTSCDRWFASLLGGTLPNRMYWHAATANGARDNKDVLDGAYRGVTTIYHRLDAAGVDWAYYYTDIPILSAIGSDLDLTNRVRRFVDFLHDAAAGVLPPITYIDPGFASNDDHPPHHPLLGQQLIAAVYQALATSPQWPRCRLVVAYDENGGFFDHVVPGTAPDDQAAAGFNQLGFRVPALVVGPYARAGYVSSVAREHTSCLRDIEKRYALTPLTMRDAAANDLSETIDEARLAAGDAAAPIQLPAVEIDESMLPPACHYGAQFTKPLDDHDIIVWAQANPQRLGSLDRTRYAADTVHEIADYLDRHGLGRIRRGR
jgi:phospholipase C